MRKNEAKRFELFFPSESTPLQFEKLPQQQLLQDFLLSGKVPLGLMPR